MLTKFLFLILTFITSFSHAGSKIEQYFNTVKSNPKELNAFLLHMPKGGDLHLHLAGATYAENLLHYAKNDKVCLNLKNYTVYTAPNCKLYLSEAIKNQDIYNQMIDAWSMRNFIPGKESGHDHFFQTFDKFFLLVQMHQPEVMAEIAENAGTQNVSYLEIMYTPDNNLSGILDKKFKLEKNFAKMRDKLLQNNFIYFTNKIKNSLNQDEKAARKILACNTKQAKIGCKVKMRYLYQVLREQSPEMVFAQLLQGFEIASKDPRFVGLNMVQPEDGFISMRDYNLHMRMISFLRKYYPNVKISLHAGELSTNIVAASKLKSHIYTAVYVSKANRIGHGVDIDHENNSKALLKYMASHGILVEINLSSNFLILGSNQNNHPFRSYLKYNVPIALSTDDEGISRDNLTKEYQIAVEQFGLDYTTLKTLARNSLAYSFLPGKGLWKDRSYSTIITECRDQQLGIINPTLSCKNFLNKNEKAKIQWDLEHRFRLFEQAYS